jgi:hypothetical protein
VQAGIFDGSLEVIRERGRLQRFEPRWSGSRKDWRRLLLVQTPRHGGTRLGYFAGFNNSSLNCLASDAVRYRSFCIRSMDALTFAE